ncbi:terminase small subunit [Enterobacter hormaechei]|uniref:terminase small subunit n=1 Tax=Enterobacteriaceae TaxID=543 RepID=UPI00098DECE3|nr:MULTISPECIES: terminase small subunit [Enterobacteriaceae]MBO1456663.1 terminase small subunit [Enterobacter hormaechei]MBO1461602.1 terminase small subunit [Enterobacter hormaechei]MBT2206427.1 terminase small subunit [Enterobacter hormaechei subsp. xiangfangensis]MCE1442390.1 terminase small subunit [Enterobacter hormaechei]MCM7434829.1 terminase small subunit [Enterobacter hormaechei]
MAVLLNKSDMASSLGISVQAFDKWGVQPVEKRGREVFFDVRSVVDNRLENQSRKLQPSPGEDDESVNIDYERWRLTRANADAQELANEKKRREVVETAFCTFVLSRIAAEISSILDGIPLSMQRRFPELENRHIEFLKGDVVKAMNKAAALDERIPGLLNDYIDQSGS